MKKMKVLVCMALVAALAFTMFAPALAEDVLKIGLIGPLTGGAAVYGISARQGAEIAVEEINALGGVQIDFKAEDDEHDPEKSVNAYNSLMDWGVQTIVGCVTSGPCIAVGTLANEERLFMLTPSATSPTVTEGRDNVYQACFTDPAQGTASAQYIALNNLGKKVAVIYNNADAYSTGIYQKFVEEAADLGLEVVSVTTFTDETTDFSVQVTNAKENGAELVFLPIYYTPASMILKQADAMEYKPLFFGAEGMDGILTLEGFDTSLAEGMMLLTAFSADAPEARSLSFVEKYRAAYGDTPTQFAANSYDCVYILYEAIQAGAVNAQMSAEEICEALIAYMPTATYEGITGTMTWLSTGEVSKTPKAVIIQDGVYVGR